MLSNFSEPSNFAWFITFFFSSLFSSAFGFPLLDEPELELIVLFTTKDTGEF